MGITLNGNETIEACPACDSLTITRHGANDEGNPRHCTDCPECGESIVIVGYDCDSCNPPADGV
jgi:hypothetical protein